MSSSSICSMLLLLQLLLSPSSSSATNITRILSTIPGYDLFNRLLSRTNVAMEINARSSLTLLCPPNSLVQPLLNTYVGGIPTQQMSDLLRYHVLLQYLDFSRMPPGSRLLTTLYQTTGRASGNSGALNVTKLDSNGGLVQIGLPFNGAPPNATIVSTLKLFSYTLSLYQISSILIPQGLSSPNPPASSSLPINITNQLAQSNRFSFFLLFLQVTGVDVIFDDSESKAGITIFAPTDEAFQKFRVQSFKMLSAEHKILVLEYHALNTFYPLGTLNTFKNPVTPTIATTDSRGGGAGLFTVNVSSVNGVVTISDGSVNAPVVATILEHEPVAIFAIDELLFPKTFLGAPAKAYPPSSPYLPPSSPSSLPPPPSPPVSASSQPPSSIIPALPPIIYFPSLTPSPSPSPVTASQASPSRTWLPHSAILSVPLAVWFFI